MLATTLGEFPPTCDGVVNTYIGNFAVAMRKGIAERRTLRDLSVEQAN